MTLEDRGKYLKWSGTDSYVEKPGNTRTLDVQTEVAVLVRIKRRCFFLLPVIVSKLTGAVDFLAAVECL